MSFNIISVFLVAVALAMDAFSVSLTKGFTQKNLTRSQKLWYESFAPVIAFVLLTGIGANMIRESLSGDDEEITDEFSFKEVTLLAVATSIDAFAVGITIALLNDPLLISAVIIGVVAFAFSIAGIYIGRKLGDYFGDKFQIIGGVILILIGIKTLLGL